MCGWKHVMCLDEPIAAACEHAASFIGLSKQNNGTIKRNQPQVQATISVQQ